MNVTSEAAQLYQVLDHVATEHWQTLDTYNSALRQLAQRLGGMETRALLHELGANHLIASYTDSVTGQHWFSQWQNRFPSDFKTRMFNRASLAQFAETYGDWTAFGMDSFAACLRAMQIPTEAMYQVNRSFLTATQLGVLESRAHGKQIRVTRQAISWLLPTTLHHNNKETV